MKIAVDTSFPPFLLGYCNCGCGKDITIYNGVVRKYRKGHYLVNNDITKFRKTAMKLRKYSKRGIYIKSPNHPFKDIHGFVYQHRLIYEHYLSIILDEDVFLIPNVDDVCHINLNVYDNRLINLELMERSEVMRQYHIKNMDDIFCFTCGSTKTAYQKGKIYFLWYNGKEPGTFLCRNCYCKNKKRIKKAFLQVL